MDRITASLLDEFSREHEITSLPEEARFEHFASYITVHRQYNETFDTVDIVVGSGGDTGIDAIAIIVNGSLVTDIESFEEEAAKTEYLEVTFVFVQAERSSSFDGSKIGDFLYGVLDFFKDTPTLVRNEKVAEAAGIMAAIYKHGGKFRRGNPACRLYYVTTGKWTGDPNLEGRRTSAISDLKATRLFRDDVEFHPIDADGIQKLYNQTKNAIERDFTFANRAVVPPVAGVTEAYLGLLPVTEFLSILRDEDGDMIKSIFYDNVRDWQDYDAVVNKEIRETLDSTFKDRFVLMNNGITIIARGLRTVANRFHIEDFQIVNGCQTSHVLFDQRDKLDDSVMIPVRLIATQNEEVINSIIRATNRQTEVKEEQFFALAEFPKKLELYFQTFDNGKKLFYERRSRQYASSSIEKTRIVTPGNVIRAFAAMFLQEPHRTTRNYSALKAKVGTEIFAEQHRLEPYYVAAFALYKLESLFRAGRLEPRYKVTRYHMLLTVRLLGNPTPLPQLNAHEMDRYCSVLRDILWDSTKADELFTRVATVIDAAASGNFKRDNIRIEPFTEKVKTLCGKSNGITR